MLIRSRGAIQVALLRLEGFQDRLAGMDPHDGPISAYQVAQRERYNAEVDYNYCLYYPIHEDFRQPLHPKVRGSEAKASPTQQKRRQLWKQVEQCMKDGTLQDLQDGRINSVDAETLNDIPLTQPRTEPLKEDYTSAGGAPDTDGIGYEVPDLPARKNPQQIRLLGKFAWLVAMDIRASAGAENLQKPSRHCEAKKNSPKRSNV